MLTSTKRDWLSIISRGGLTTPTTEWVQKVTQFEIICGGIHGSTISHGKDIIKTLYIHLRNKFPEQDEKVINVYGPMFDVDTLTGDNYLRMLQKSILPPVFFLK